MKIIFAGSPEFAVKPLERLCGLKNVQIVAVVTQPDRPLGRKRVITPTPVKSAALKAGLTVCDFERIRDHAQELKSFFRAKCFPRSRAGCGICTPRFCPNCAALRPFNRLYLRANRIRA